MENFWGSLGTCFLGCGTDQLFFDHIGQFFPEKP